MVSMSGRMTAAIKPSNRIPIRANKDGVGCTVEDRDKLKATSEEQCIYNDC